MHCSMWVTLNSFKRVCKKTTTQTTEPLVFSIHNILYKEVNLVNP